MSLLMVAMLMQTAVSKPVPVVATTPPQIAVPFAVGESLTYKAKSSLLPFGLGAGSATLAVLGVEKVRGVDSWKFYMALTTSVPAFRNKTTLTSYTGVQDFISRRFVKTNDGHRADTPDPEDFYIYPDSGFFRRGKDAGTKPTTKEPLDDAAFLYFIRTVSMKLGETLVYPRYYRANIRDLTINVIGREKMKLPDGTMISCLIINPVVDQQPNGMFRKEAKARLWITEDARRIPVKIESKYPWGTIRLELEKMVIPVPPR